MTLAGSLGDFRRDALGAEAFAGIAEDVLLSIADEAGRRVACRVPVLLVGRPEAGRWGPAMVKGQRANCSDNSKQENNGYLQMSILAIWRENCPGWLLEVDKLCVYRDQCNRANVCCGMTETGKGKCKQTCMMRTCHLMIYALESLTRFGKSTPLSNSAHAPHQTTMFSSPLINAHLIFNLTTSRMSGK